MVLKSLYCYVYQLIVCVDIYVYISILISKSSHNNTRGVTLPSVIVNPSPTGHPLMILVCDLIFVFIYFSI